MPFRWSVFPVSTFLSVMPIFFRRGNRASQLFGTTPIHHGDPGICHGALSAYRKMQQKLGNQILLLAPGIRILRAILHRRSGLFTVMVHGQVSTFFFLFFFQRAITFGIHFVCAGSAQCVRLQFLFQVP